MKTLLALFLFVAISGCKSSEPVDDPYDYDRDAVGGTVPACAIYGMSLGALMIPATSRLDRPDLSFSEARQAVNEKYLIESAYFPCR